MKLQFTKMHGLGNDFVVFDAINQSVQLSADQIRAIADRHTGIGCDQLLLVEAPQDAQSLFNYRIFNADGGEVEQCGNGARCFARFVLDHGLTTQTSIPVTTRNGRLELSVEDDGQVTVNMGIPEFEPANIPFTAPARAERYSLDVNGEQVEIGAVSMGNPHAVMQVDDVTTAPVSRLGPLIESHARFPNRVNAGFMQVIDQNLIKLRVFERGVGETQACGTGACAAMVIGRYWDLLADSVQVMLTGGTLTISWRKEGEPVFMTGPAQSVFEGTIEL